MRYPYSTTTGSITKILEKIQTVGQPSKVDSKWFSSIGFKTASEHRMSGVLKFIGFVEDNGTPTGLWTQFRSTKTGKCVLGKALKKSYRELYDIYPNAHELGKNELTDFFKTKTVAGNQALKHTVNTFQNMASYAVFNDNDSSTLTDTNNELNAVTPNEIDPNPLTRKMNSTGSGVVINLNIQLTVPETLDEKVYEKFFEAMKRHLLS